MIGVDEVGRGAWAGPLLVVAVKLKSNKKLPKGITDSKKLTKNSRIKLFPKLIDACFVGEGWVSASVIDEIGLSNAMKNACLLAVTQIGAKHNDKILLDGNINYFVDSGYKNVKTQIKADLKYPIVSCASIIAKVLRDEIMNEYAEDFPEYDLKNNVGYGTPKHISALTTHGPTKMHRQSYKPIKELRI